MTAETLRRAANLMRERAENPQVPPGPWSWRWIGQEATVLDPTGDFLVENTYVVSNNGIAGHLREDVEGLEAHIASWHPAVALAVADWLANFADHWDAGDYGPDEWDAAVAVARAYLGEAS